MKSRRARRCRGRRRRGGHCQGPNCQGPRGPVQTYEVVRAVSKRFLSLKRSYSALSCVLTRPARAEPAGGVVTVAEEVGGGEGAGEGGASEARAEVRAEVTGGLVHVRVAEC